MLHSLSTEAIEQTGPVLQYRGPWSTREHFWYARAASCLQAQKIYGRIDLVSDSLGASILVDRLHLPYHHVSTSLDHLVLPSKCHAKVRACEMQEQSFLHIDDDVVFHKKLPAEFETAPVIVESAGVQICDTAQQEFASLIAELRVELPDKDELRCSETASGRGFSTRVVGGNDLTQTRRYTVAMETVFKSEAYGSAQVRSLSRSLAHLDSLDMAVDQLIAYKTLSNRNDWPYPLFYLDELDEQSERSFQIGYFPPNVANPKTVRTRSDAIRDVQLNYPQIIESVARMLYESA